MIIYLLIKYRIKGNMNSLYLTILFFSIELIDFRC